MRISHKIWPYSPLLQLLPNPPPFPTNPTLYPLHYVDILLEHGWPSRGNTLKETQLYFSQQLSVTSRFLIRCGTSCLHPSFMLGFGLAWDYMGLVRVCCHNFSEFLCVAALLCLENTVSLYSSASSDSCSLFSFWNNPKPWEEGWGIDMMCLITGFWLNNSARYECYLLEKNLHLIREWLVTPVAFKPLLQQWACLARLVVIVTWRVHNCGSSMATVFSPEVCIEPSSTMKVSQ